MLPPIEAYELKAEAFRIMTGEMAPGKDVPPGRDCKPLKERMQMWDDWLRQHAIVIRAFDIAAARVFNHEE